jgi:hypothetical protein
MKSRVKKTQELMAYVSSYSVRLTLKQLHMKSKMQVRTSIYLNCILAVP